jgi:hypothetical protein
MRALACVGLAGLVAVAALAVATGVAGCRVDCVSAAGCARGELCADDGTCARLPNAAPVGAISPGTYMEATAVYPPPGGHDVPPRAPIVVLTTRPVDPTSVPGAFSLTDAHGQPVAGALDWLVDPPGFLFAPAQPLAAGASYNAHVTTAVHDGGGDALHQPVAWSFDTVAP